MFKDIMKANRQSIETLRKDGHRMPLRNKVLYITCAIAYGPVAIVTYPLAKLGSAICDKMTSIEVYPGRTR